MKLLYVILSMALIAGVVFWPAQQARAQGGDTLIVQWETTPGSLTPLVNALYNAVRGDTVAGGARKNANRVYKLLKGGFYWNTERIDNAGYHLRLVGEAPGATALDNPAVIQMHPRPDNSVDGRIITGKSHVTLKNLWLTGRDYNGVQTYYQPIQMDANNSRFVIDNCVLEQTNFALIAYTGKNNNIFYTNCKFRNLIGQPSTQQWEGRGMSIWADQDSVVVENCTFFNVGFCPFQLEGGAAKYIRFNHNTMVNIGRQVNVGNWFRDAYFANNLCVNTWWHGEGAQDMANPNRDPRAVFSGLFSIGALPSTYGPEQGRRIVFANTAAYLDPKFVTFYGDTIRRARFIDPVTKADFLDKYTEHMKVKDTTWLVSEPGLPSYPGVSALIDSMWRNITDLRAGITPAHRYYFSPTQYPTDVSWPLPENFAYTDATLKTKGTDGLPLGDLNWFPTQKAQWEAGRDGFITAIENLAGPKVVFQVDTTVQAEIGTLSGTAAKKKADGFAYYKMESAGSIKWTFNLAVPGTYELVVYTNMEGNTVRGENIYVNSVNIRNNSGYGEYNFTAPPLSTNQWDSVRIKAADLIEGASALTMAAGTNTIEIRKSWGYQSFAEVHVVTSTGTRVAVLSVPDAVVSGVIPFLVGAKWAPSGFWSVAMGSNGTITWNLNPSGTGTFRVRIFYQNYGSAQTAQLKVDGATALPAIPLGFKADSTGLDVMSDAFPLTAGAHSVALVGSQVNVDYLQLIKESIISSVGDNELPRGFALEQNYPNPFNPATTINFVLGKASNVKLVVFNVLGQRVATLLDSRLEAGPHIVRFDARNLASGVYFYRLEAGQFISNKKMMLLK